jgi:hypothetical protein
MIRQEIEEGFEIIVTVDDEIRGIVARNWPHLLSKLPPKDAEWGGPSRLYAEAVQDFWRE